ncbi:MAG: family 2 glycosyl transferase [Clostridia bacterium]|nr:family 2 glycosyl transferase [Clostridia bacterium]
MKKVIITVAVTLVCLFILAQTGLLAPFGIHQLSIFRKKEQESTDLVKNADEFTDIETDIHYRFKADGQNFYVFREGEWRKLFMTGVNIGATEPGLFPGDLSISYETYYRWFGYISAMNCNCIRVYTAMGPQFYLALNDYNKTADNPLYLYQGVWVNEEDIDRLNDVYAENEKILNGFMEDALTLVDIIHGNAVVAPSPGEASGTYRTDVSRWLAGWIIGIEWDPNLVLNTNSQHPDKREYDGEYLYTQSSTPFEAFLCRVGDAVIKKQSETYNFQSPFAVTNWITTDPLIHPNEPYQDEDKAVVNSESIKSRKFAAGMFASYHIYPYYPDSLNYQEDYISYRDEKNKVNPYEAYLKDLKLVHNLPILVAEFGIPTSRGMGHESIMGYNQGGVDETKQGEMLTDMFDSIYETGYAGGLVFTWQDEWFKRTWNNVMFDLADHRAYWSNIQTSEQSFGLLAFDPGSRHCVCYIDGEYSDWEGVSAVATTDHGAIYVQNDERYLYICVKAENYDFNNDTLFIPINTIEGQGNARARDYGLTFNDYADFLIKIHGANDSHILVDRYYDAFRYYFVESKMLVDVLPKENSGKKDSGYFDDMLMCYGYNLTVKGTGETVKDKVYETGKLKYGNGNPSSEKYESLADFCYGSGCVEIRIPWQLLNVMDPSTKQQIGDFYADQMFSTVSYDSFSFGFGITKTGEKAEIEINGSYIQKGWSYPAWHERLKPSYYVLQKYLAQYRTGE